MRSILKLFSKENKKSNNTFMSIVKCCVFVLAFLLLTISKIDKVDAAHSFTSNTTSSCWSASGSNLNVNANCTKYSYTVSVETDYHSTVSTQSVTTSFYNIYFTINGTKYGGTVWENTGGGYSCTFRGFKGSQFDLFLEYSSSASSVSFSSSYSSGSAMSCSALQYQDQSRFFNNDLYLTIPTSLMAHSISISGSFKMEYYGGSQNKNLTGSTISLVDKVGPTAPTIISNDSNGSCVNRDVYIKVGNSTDYFTGVSYYQYSYDKSTWYNDIDGTGSYNNSSGAYGSWRAERNATVYFRAVDNAGNAGAASASGTKVCIDKTAPTLSIGTPTNGTVVGSGTNTAYHAQPSKSMTVTFTDNLGLSSYSSTSYYRYKWCDNSSSCSTSWTAITGTRTSTQVSGSITTPSTTGVHYLWIEGDVKDNVGNYMSNSTNIGGITSTSSSNRIFKFNIDNTAPVVSVSSGNTSTYTYLKNGSSITITITDSSYGFNTSAGYLSVELWDGEDPIASGDLTVSSSNSGITTKTYTMTISTTVSHELKVRISALTDYAGNTSTTVIYLYYIDNTPPTLTIGTPSGGTTTGSGTSTNYISAPSKSLTIIFSDNYALYSYDSTSFYRYKWCTSSSSCSTSWTAITGTRTSTQVSGSITTPSTGGVHYLWIEGDARDVAGNYMSNSTNIGGLTSTSSSNRIFKFTIDTTAPVLTIGTPTNGTVVGSGTSTAYHAQPSKSVTVTFTDNAALSSYSSTSYYRYRWCTSSSSCSASYTSVGTSRTITKVTGTITTPSTTGVHYLWIEGDARDVAGNYMSNSTNIGGITSTSSSARVFKFNIDNTAPVVSVSSGNTSTYTYLKNGSSITITITDSSYGFNASGGYLSVELWDGEDPVASGDLTVSSSNSGITTKTYTMTISTTVSHELKVRISALTDYAGNAATTVIYLYYIDNTPPTLTIGTPTNGTVVGSGTSTAYHAQPSKSVTLTFTDNYALSSYSSTSYYRYKWCDNSSSCSTSWTAITGTRTLTQVSGSITTPSTAGVHYLWIEGDARDVAGNYMSNSTNIGGLTSTSSSARVFKFNIDNTAPVVSVSSGNTSTYTYLKNGSSITITITDSSYGFNASGGYLSVELWDGEDPVASGDLTVSSSNSGITTKTYTMTISTTVSHELKVRISALTDYAGNAATTVIYLYYIDNTPPTLTIGTPSGGTTNGSGTSTIYYSEASKSMTITFTENYELYAYNSTSYYRYKWCTSSSSCSTSWTAITGTRTSTQVSGSITTPSTEGIHYLWIEGDARDLAINYVSNSTNIEGITSTSSSARVFKVIVDRTAPILTIGTPTSGTIVGTGTNTTHYAQSNKNVTITFTDNYALYYYEYTSYYRYKWCTSSSSCSASYTSVGTSRTITKVTGTITTPSTAGVHYLWIEGDVKDLVGHYMSNSANINAVGTTSSGARIFKFNIDNTPISVSSRSYSNYKGAWSNGSTTSTTYVKNGDQIEVTLTDSVYGFNTSGSYLAVSMWDGEDPIEQGYISLSKTSTGITTIKYTITIATTLTYELNIRLDNLVDYAGNTTSETIYLYHVDNGAPNVSAQGYNTYKGSWYTANTTSYTYLRNGDKLSITLNDSLAGFDTAGSYFRVKLWDGEDPIQNGYLSLSKTPSGGYQLVYNVSISTTSTRELLVNINGLVDNIGNATPDLTFMFYIDNTAPVVGSYSNTSGGGLTNKNVTISVTGGSDAHSNIHEYKYSTNNTTYSSLGASKTWTAEIDTPVYIRLYDNVGNYSYMATTNVRIDRTKPITNISVTTSNNTAIVYFTDNKSISSTDANIGNDYEYYISSNSNLDVSKLTASQWIKPAGNVERGSGNDQMHIGRGQQYLYIKLPNDITDTAGNTIRDPYSTAISGYTVIKTTITGSSTTPISPSNINSKARSGVQITGNYVVEILDNFVIVTFDSEATLPNGFTMKTINEALSSAGYRLISVDDNAEFDFESSSLYVTLIGNDVDGILSTQNDIYQLMVLINAPTTGGGNAGARVLEQGEELGNIAVAFTSDIEFSVDTLITLNGVKVKEVDTNKPGVYEVRSVATDIMGRVNKVNRTIVVKEGVKEEVEVKVEEIKETPEVITPVVVNNAPVEVQPEANANRKVVENIQVEMRIENKEEVKGYKKKEEKNKKNKENKGTFKLFSKWFFKVYDG